MNLTIPGTEVQLKPVPRKQLGEFRGLMIQLLSKWLDCQFSVGDVVMDDDAWALMKQAIAMLPREGGGDWDDLDKFSSEYDWLEKTFFAQHKEASVKIGNDENGDPVHFWSFNLSTYRPGSIVEMHLIDHLALVTKADELRKPKEEPQGKTTPKRKARKAAVKAA